MGNQPQVGILRQKPDSSIARRSPRPDLFIAGGGFIIAIFILSIIQNPLGPAVLFVGGPITLGIVWKGWHLARHDPLWLAFALMLVQFLEGCFFLSDRIRPIVIYSLTMSLCFPAMPLLWQAWKAHHSGFKLYLVYFCWCLITVSYSLVPLYSLVRLMRSLLLFVGVIACAQRARQPAQMQRLLRGLLLTCIVFTLANAAAAVLLPRGLTWSDVVAESSLPSTGDEIARFSGLFSNPSRIGELALVTIGLILTCFTVASAKERLFLTAAAVLVTGLTAMADSRSGLVGLALGSSFYACWKFRLKGFLIVASGVLIGLLGLRSLGPDLAIYVWRGDVRTVTGRADMWPFVLQQIALKPILGYGYGVAGAIFQSRYFPLWWGPWDEGVHSSVHNGYLQSMVGVGIPATIFWLFIMLRPWLCVLSRSEDPYRLKPLLFFIIIPLLIVNLDEEMLNDCAGPSGLLFAIGWAIGERHRLAIVRRFDRERRQVLQGLPGAVAALRSS